VSLVAGIIKVKTDIKTRTSVTEPQR